MTLTRAGTARTTRDIVDVEHWRGCAAVTESGDRLAADLAVHTHRRADRGLYPTIDHGAVASYAALFVTWTRISPAGLAGRPHQPAPDLIAAAAPLIPAPDWAALRVLWERWHCSALSPGCSHQAPPLGSDVREALAAAPDCPEDGYRFGSGWLVRDLPRDVLRRARQVGASLAVST